MRQCAATRRPRRPRPCEVDERLAKWRPQRPLSSEWIRQLPSTFPRDLVRRRTMRDWNIEVRLHRRSVSQLLTRGEKNQLFTVLSLSAKQNGSSYRNLGWTCDLEPWLSCPGLVVPLMNRLGPAAKCWPPLPPPRPQPPPPSPLPKFPSVEERRTLS